MQGGPACTGPAEGVQREPGRREGSHRRPGDLDRAPGQGRGNESHHERHRGRPTLGKAGYAYGQQYADDQPGRGQPRPRCCRDGQRRYEGTEPDDCAHDRGQGLPNGGPHPGQQAQHHQSGQQREQAGPAHRGGEPDEQHAHRGGTQGRVWSLELVPDRKHRQRGEQGGGGVGVGQGCGARHRP